MSTKERKSLTDVIANAREASPAPQPEPTRCAVCGWPLAETRDKGCRPGDCSFRPLPDKAYDTDRANREYAEFWGTRWSRRWDAPQPAESSFVNWADEQPAPAGAREPEDDIEYLKSLADRAVHGQIAVSEKWLRQFAAKFAQERERADKAERELAELVKLNNLLAGLNVDRNCEVERLRKELAHLKEKS